MEKDDMDEDHLLEQFDRLVEQGVLVYNPNYRTVAQSDQGFSVRPIPSLESSVSNHLSSNSASSTA